jgi:hypothetical protein
MKIKSLHNRRTRWLLLTTLAIGSAACLYLYRTVYIHHVPLGFENTGVEIALVARWPKEISYDRELLLKQNGDTAKLLSLEQLRGQVHITKPEEALLFVRFRTSPAFCEYWPWPREVEIIDLNDARQLPSYGEDFQLNDYDLSYVRDGGSDIPVDWGLTHEAYQAGHFTPPSIAPVTGGFSITRWIFSQRRVRSPPGSLFGWRLVARVMKVQEFVGVDGQYHRAILSEAAPPKLARTSWYINRERL